jgi:hypothetical protein
MAVTKLIAVGNKKGGIGATLDYAMNPAKTENCELVSGINCTPQTAAHEFDFTKINADKKGGRQGYHLIQSFAHGEIDYHTAHEIGKQLANNLLQGRFEAVVCTHNDKSHIHNHIVFNSVSFKDKKKFHGASNIFHKIAELSDNLCENYNLSIIEKRKEKGKSYAEYNAERQGKSWKAKLRETIDCCISKAKEWEEFLSLMQAEHYEIKRGKFISFRAEGQERFTRAKTLGENYSEENIKTNFSGKAKIELPKTNLIIDIDNHIKAKQSAGYKHWAQIHNLRIAAQTINFLSDNKLLSYENLIVKYDKVKAKRDTTKARIKKIEARIKELDKQINDLDTYRKNKPIVEKLETVFSKEKYERENEYEINQFNSAKKSCKKHFPNGKFPLIKTLRAEMNELYEEKEKLYLEYYEAKNETTELWKIKSNVDMIFRQEPEQERQNRRRNKNEIEL